MELLWSSSLEEGGVRLRDDDFKSDISKLHKIKKYIYIYSFGLPDVWNPLYPKILLVRHLQAVLMLWLGL